ncbi:unnamed protein product, partial [Acanthocheilonema viteae]
MKQRPEIALTEMQLCNDADVPLLYKLCSDTTSSITATPAGSGCIPPRAEQRCFLTWRRSKYQQIEQDMKTPKLILITNFVEQEIDKNQTVVTKLIARIHSEGEQAGREIPLMKFTFERKEVILSSETLTANRAASKKHQTCHSNNTHSEKQHTSPPPDLKCLRKRSVLIGIWRFAVVSVDFIDSMEKEINAAVPSSSNSSSISNFSNDTNSRVSYLSSVKSNVTGLSGIFPFSSRITSSSFSSFKTDRSKICRYCLSDDAISNWLAPCKCIGTMKWVHLSCFEQWLSFAPYTMKYSCAICNYVYRRQWKLKPYKHWQWPQFRLRITDIFGIYFDITLTYRIYRYFPRCLDNRFSIDVCFMEVVMSFERMKHDKWEACESFGNGFSDGDQFSRTNLKICRFCYVEGSGEIDWLRPCKCSGSMLWVHKQCFNSWLGKASGRSRIQCQIC